MWTFAKSVFYSFLDDEALSRGGSIAFFTATSIAPVLLLVVAMAGLVFGEEAARGAVFAQLQGLMGSSTADVIQTALANSASKSSGILATVIGSAMLLVTASGVFGELQSALNKIWKVKPASVTITRFVKARAVSLGLVATLGFLLIVSLVASAGLTAIGTYFGTKFLGWPLILSISNFAISFGLLSLLFAAVYKFLPDCPVAWRDGVIGGVVTSGLFVIGKTLVGWYLGSSAVASTYGAAGGLMVLLIWIYYSTQIFLLGAEITKAYADSRSTKRAGRSTKIDVHATLPPLAQRERVSVMPAIATPATSRRSAKIFRQSAAVQIGVLVVVGGLGGLLGAFLRSRLDAKPRR